MSTTTEVAPIYITVLPRPGGLAASLTDLRLLARLETIDTGEDVLGDLERESQAPVFPPVAAPGAGAEAAGALCELGGRLLRHLLPPGVAQWLRDAPAGALTLQIDHSLAWVPWEFLWDGENFLGEKFRLCRRLVADAAALRAAPALPHRGAVKVLLVGGGAAAAAAVARLHAGLRGIAGLAVSAVQSGELPREELLRLVGASQVVHYVGPVDGRATPDGSVGWWREGEPLAIGALGLPASVPLLLVSQDESPAASAAASANREVALGACRLGLNLLACEPAGALAAHDFMVEVYAALARGATAAEAVRLGRIAFRRSAGLAALAALRAELHGDGALVLNERRTSVEDNLRQVTIVSIDLAGSTRLLGELGAEKYSDLLAQYHWHCVDILLSHGGAPDDFQGDDGAMCYFGTPVAREDAAAQALQAALELIEAMQALGLGVRIGVCTGQVVVRDGQPVGSAIHLAARLQSIAAPGTVVVGESTRRIVKDRFRFQLLEQGILLKGFDEPQTCHRLLGPTLPASAERQGAQRSPAATPFIGRREELQALEAHWEAVRSGSLRVVRVLGEAGIGKSRLVREFKQILMDAGHEVFESRCSPEHANSAFHPIIESLRNELRVGANEPAEALQLRLRALVSRTETADEGAATLLADLLLLPIPVPHPVLEKSAERRRQLTVDLLVALAQHRVRRAPGCWIVEDVHWLDPSTAEILDRLAMASRDLPLLILVTARADAEPRWRPRCAVVDTELQGLSPALSRAMVLSACGERRLPAEIVQRIAGRADGVPLFIEESTRMAVDLSAARDLVGLVAMPVPTTVLDLLTARLDRLGAAKQVAQVGGTIGREFPLALLQAVMQHPGSPIAAQDVAAPLAELVRAGMLVARDEGEEARFAFRHVLMRDAAYGSLLERDRLRLHQVIAGVMGERFAELARQQPELLAFHYTEAGMHAEALRFWEAAVRKAAARSAHAEAIGHVGSALAVLARMPTDDEQRRVELRLQLLLAARLIATRGYGAGSVERAYARAMELARLLGDEGAEMRVLLGLEGYHFMRADFDQARAHALEAAERAGSRGGAIQRVQTQWALANIRMHQGDMKRAVQEMDACRAEYMRLEHRPEAVQDPGVMCLCYSAWSLWQLGFPDEARDRIRTVVAHAEQIQHKFSLGEVYGFRAAVLHFRGENPEALEAAERAVRICEENGFAVWLAHARVMRGRIAAELGHVAAGVQEMRHGYELWAESGAVVTTPFYLAMRAEGHALDHRPDDGLALLEQALAIVNRTGERYYEAEILRLVGVLTLQKAAGAGLDRNAEAQEWLLRALECARARELASLALRAATNLADLWHAQGSGAQALARLEAACRGVEGGEGTRDVVLARERLRSLRSAA